VVVWPPPREPGPSPTPPPARAPPPAPPPRAPAAAAAPPPAYDGSRFGVPAHDPHPLLDLDEGDAPSLEIAGGGPTLDVLPFAADPVAPPAPRRAPPRPGGAPPARRRSPEAQAAFERGLREMESGGAGAAASLLRRALSLAPGDPEIAEAIARLATRDAWGTRGRTK
jgi:hypothetical protein